MYFGLTKHNAPVAVPCLLAATLLAAWQNAPSAPPATHEVNLTDFGQAGIGGDDTKVFQAALKATASAGEILHVRVSSVPYQVQPLYLPSNTKLILDAGVVIQSTSGYGLYSPMINMDNVSNVTINATGSTFQMNKAEYTTGEYRHCTAILGASDVTIQGMTCNDSGGDGIYVAGGSNQSYSYNVTVQDSTFNNNRRDAMSLISGQSIYFRRCHFTNTNGTPMEDGIDIEPNTPTDRLVDIHIEDSETDGNHGDGFNISLGSLTASSPPVDITVLRHHSGFNAGSGFSASYEANGNVPGVAGTIMIDSGRSERNGTYGAVTSFYNGSGPVVTFRNLHVADVNQSRTTYDNAAIAVKRGGGGIGPIGNVFFLNPTIIDTTGKLDYYFTLRLLKCGFRPCADLGSSRGARRGSRASVRPDSGPGSGLCIDPVKRI
jgi:hypothetical protein